MHKTSREIEEFLARRFPGTRPTPPPTLGPIPTPPVELAAGQVKGATPMPDLLLAVVQVEVPGPELAAGQVGTAPNGQLAAGQVEPRPRLFVLKTAIDEETHDDLRAIQDLLGHALPSGDLRILIKRMARFYRAYLQRRRFGAPGNRRNERSRNPRHVPAHLRRAVTKRDGGRCTFVGDAGRQCATRRYLEFDHIEPVARGGRTTVDNLRLRCHAHNQLEAERVFGAQFMQEKRKPG